MRLLDGLGTLLSANCEPPNNLVVSGAQPAESIVENEKPIEICTHQEATKVQAELFRGLITLLVGKGVLSVSEVMVTIKFTLCTPDLAFVHQPKSTKTEQASAQQDETGGFRYRLLVRVDFEPCDVSCSVADLKYLDLLCRVLTGTERVREK